MSNPVPSALALVTIADSSKIVAADHRSNYSNIQTDMNAFVTAMSGGASGQVLTAASASAVAWAYPPGYEIGYDQITAVVNVVSTAEATGTTIIACAAHTFDGAPVMCHFYTPGIAMDNAAAGDQMLISLFEAATEIGRFAVALTPSITAQMFFPAINGFLRFTPTAAAHTYTVTAKVTSTTGTPRVLAGVGSTADYNAAFGRFTKV